MIETLPSGHEVPKRRLKMFLRRIFGVPCRLGQIAIKKYAESTIILKVDKSNVENGILRIETSFGWLHLMYLTCSDARGIEDGNLFEIV